MEVKDSFIGLLNSIRTILKDPKTIKKWDNLIKIFQDETPEQLQEHFHYNNIYQLDFLIDDELGEFKLFKMPVLKNHIKNINVYNQIKQIDEHLTIQLSNILPKIYIAGKIIQMQDKNIPNHINSLYSYIEERNNVNCLLKWILEYYSTTV
jgi:hypothetical protein